MSYIIARRRSALFGLAIVAVFAGLVFTFNAVRRQMRAAPDFTLTDQHGKSFSLSRERGHPTVLFFGYTHCPDACPLTLAHLVRALRVTKLDADARVVFVTVDPQRDTSEVLKSYLALFDRRFIGLTGSPAQIAVVEKAYHTWSEALPAPKSGDYTVSHGATTYFIDRSGTLRGFGSWDDSPELVAHDLRSYFS